MKYLFLSLACIYVTSIAFGNCSQWWLIQSTKHAFDVVIQPLNVVSSWKFFSRSGGRFKVLKGYHYDFVLHVLYRRRLMCIVIVYVQTSDIYFGVVVAIIGLAE